MKRCYGCYRNEPTTLTLYPKHKKLRHVCDDCKDINESTFVCLKCNVELDKPGGSMLWCPNCHECVLYNWKKYKKL